MKLILLILISILSTLGFGQTLTDVASTHNIPSIPTASEFTGIGLSFYDFDEDGWDDLTFPINNDSILFYRNNNGNFEQIDSYIIAIGVVREILWVDYDNDMDLDIGISYDDAGFRLYQNDGYFHFMDVTASVGISTTPFKAYGFAFADPDKDGDLDFYLASHEVPIQFSNPQVNFYYENQGNGTFVEKAQMLGIDNGPQPTFMPVWFDYNNDDNLDLALINDKSLWNDALYKNNGLGTYVDFAPSLGFSNNGHNPMSLSISDYNNDGFQDVFKTDIGSDLVEQGVALDHKLYQNDAGTGFTEIAQGTGLDTNLFSWGALWVDYNNDSFEDLFISTTLGPGFESLLFKNINGFGFDLMNDSIIGNLIHTSYSAVKGDINNDGFYDIVVLNHQDVPNVLLNSGSTNNYIKVDLVGNYSNQKAIGATIEVYANGQHQTQMVFCGSGMCAQNSQHKIFGVGSANIVDSVIVSFPSGIVSKKENLSVNQQYTFIEQMTIPLDISGGVDTVYACAGEQFQIEYPGLTNYEWSTGDQSSAITVQSTGWYYFEATNQVQDTLFVSNPVYYDYEAPLNVLESVQQPGCGSASDGVLELILTPWQIVSNVSWSNGDSGVSLNGMPADTYDYTITTNNTCIYSGSITLQNTPVFTTQVMTQPETDTATGVAQFYIWGGVQPFLFILNGDTLSNPVTNLSAGNYDIVIIDATGCSDTINFQIYDHSTVGVQSLGDSEMMVFADQAGIYIRSAEVQSISSIEMFDMMGAKILNASNSNWKIHSELMSCRIADIAPGMYRIVVSGENFIESRTVCIF